MEMFIIRPGQEFFLASQIFRGTERQLVRVTGDLMVDLKEVESRFLSSEENQCQDITLEEYINCIKLETEAEMKNADITCKPPMYQGHLKYPPENCTMTDMSLGGDIVYSIYNILLAKSFSSTCKRPCVQKKYETFTTPLTLIGKLPSHIKSSH